MLGLAVIVMGAVQIWLRHGSGGKALRAEQEALSERRLAERPRRAARRRLEGGQAGRKTLERLDGDLGRRGRRAGDRADRLRSLGALRWARRSGTSTSISRSVARAAPTVTSPPSRSGATPGPGGWSGIWKLCGRSWRPAGGPGRAHAGGLFETIYLGGGTPTALPADVLVGLVEDLAARLSGPRDRVLGGAPPPGAMPARRATTRVHHRGQPRHHRRAASGAAGGGAG